MEFDHGEVSREELHRLSRRTGTKLKDLLALGTERDPFNGGTPQQVADADWFMALAERYDLLGVHGRGIFYRLVSVEEIQGTRADYERIGRAMNAVRDLALVTPWAFPDERAELILADGREQADPEYSPPWLMLPRSPSLKGDELEFSPLAHQPVRVVVMIEKRDPDLLREILPACRSHGVQVFVTTGFSGRGLAGEIARTAIADGRPLVLLWFSDADSAGETMPTATARILEYIQARDEQVPPIYVEHAALTLEQVKGIEQEIGRGIPRAPDVAREIGRVELNAVPIFAPGWLARRLRAALDGLTVEIEEPVVDVPEQIRDVLDKAERVAWKLHRRQERRFRVVEDAVDDALDGWDPVIPDADVPEPDLERDWLLDPRRGYVEQLNAYRRHGPAHRDHAPLDLRERTCDWCGEPIPEERKVTARFCSLDHANKASRARRR